MASSNSSTWNFRQTAPSSKWDFRQTALNAAQVKAIAIHLNRVAAEAKAGWWKK